MQPVTRPILGHRAIRVLLLLLPFVPRERQRLHATQLSVRRSQLAHHGGSLDLLLLYSGYALILVRSIARSWASEWQPKQQLGLILFASGTILRMRALTAIAEVYHPEIVVFEGHRIVRSGPYGRLRHPLAVGLFLEMAGLSIIGWSRVSTAVLGLLTVTLIRRNRHEERVLLGHFGDEYREYLARAWV
jgi:protein-S-isoprenylcysteine O-methyltransferase